MDGKWSNEEKAEILKAFTVLATIQKTYGKEIDVKPTLQAWEYVMASKYSGAQVVAAMQAYMEKSPDMPVPANIIALINPEKPKISQAEFIHAKDQWAKEGYPSYSYYAMIVKGYEKENNEGRNPEPVIEDERVLAIVQNTVKKIA